METVLVTGYSDKQKNCQQVREKYRKKERYFKEPEPDIKYRADKKSKATRQSSSHISLYVPVLQSITEP